MISRSTLAVTDRAEAELRGATPHSRLGAAAGRSNPTSKEQRLHGRRRAEWSYSTFKVRRGGSKEQWLHFAGAALKRYPTSKVRETQLSW